MRVGLTQSFRRHGELIPIKKKSTPSVDCLSEAVVLTSTFPGKEAAAAIRLSHFKVRSLHRVG